MGNPLFVMGPGGFLTPTDDLKKSARHSQYSKDSATYAKDAEGLYKQHLTNPVPMNCAQKWSNIHVKAFG